jgi:hypothetical protein
MDLLLALPLALALLFLPACFGPSPEVSAPTRVEVLKTQHGWTLTRDGRPYLVKGAGGHEHLQRLKDAGGNSIRTWDGEGIDELLDEAHALGLTVTVGIWLEHERHGNDYDDPETRAAQLAKVERIVRAYRDHPAVLIWGVGNEVEIGSDMDKAFRAVEEAAALVKSLDPNHPTMGVIAEIGSNKAKKMLEACPSIDLLGINSYAGVTSIPQRLTAQGVDHPYLITEFGPRGHWEGGLTPWGAPIEPSSAEKAEMYERHYTEGVASEIPGRCLGSYVFLWGQKQETTATWFGMFLDTGEALPPVDVMQRMWTGAPPANSAPRVGAIRTDTRLDRTPPGTRMSLTADISDPDEDTLRVEWRVVRETTDRRMGGDAEQAPPEIPSRVISSDASSAIIAAPEEPGAYRIFVYAFDESGNAGTSNLPFRVIEPDADTPSETSP